MGSFLPLLTIIILTKDGITGVLINQCCPPGEILKADDAGCTTFNSELPPIIAEWTSGGESEIEPRAWNGTRSQCSATETLIPALFLYGPDIDINIDDITGEIHLLINGTEIDSYSNDKFCYFHAVSGSGELISSYSVCYEEFTPEEKVQFKFKSVFYPSALLVSAFFILVTIIFYLTVGGLRKTIFSKITLGFLLNAFICYLFLGISYCVTLSESEVGDFHFLGSLPCKILGYTIHHTFIAFFFWMTAMAFNIAKSLSVMQIARNQNSSMKNTLLYGLYAQGIPALVSIFIILMDFIQPSNTLLPNVGEFNCFVGSEYSPEDYFFMKSEFIYFYLIVIVLLTFNFICFLVTAINLFKHWSNMQGIQNSGCDGVVEHFFIIVKLSIIMGVPWILDVVSAAMPRDSDSFPIEVTLDVVNLLTGILIFFTLICKVSVWRQIKESYSVIPEKRSLHTKTSSNSSNSHSTSFKRESSDTARPVRSV